MWLNKKIKSFTITELLVVMILTTIVVAIALLVLTFIQKEISTIQKNYSKTSEIKTLEIALWNDFNVSSVYFFKENNSLICISPVDTIVYNFKKDVVIRNADTLKLEISELNVLRNNKPAVGLIDGLKLKLSDKFQQRGLFVYTFKSAEFYMND